MSDSLPYREDLFQWIWANLEFDCTNLQTACGKRIKIVDTGECNHGAGPDFLGAHLIIDGNKWFGSVEIHKRAGEWFQHKHHEDQNFNSVILHVVYESELIHEVRTKDGHAPYTLCLKPFIQKNIYRLLEAKQENGIACTGNISFISQQAFERQVQAVHREYLEYKISELFTFYNPSLPLSVAWKDCLTSGIYKSLGIPSNQAQMTTLSKIVISKEFPSKQEDFISEVQNTAFESGAGIEWNHTGMRPASRPVERVKQAASLHYTLKNTPFEVFFKQSPEQSWKIILENCKSNRPGRSRLKLLKQIVYLPALCFLGDLLHSNDLKKMAMKRWESHPQHVPEEVKKPFRKAGFSLTQPVKVVGLAHQYKRYCREGNCHRCQVFKKAIQS